MKVIDIQLLQEEILKYAKCTEFKRFFHVGCDIWLTSLGREHSLVLVDNSGMPIGKSSFDMMMGPPNGLIVKELILAYLQSLFVCCLSSQ